MRNGSAALVPLFIGIMLLFWAIMFLGGAADNLVKVKNTLYHQDIEERLLSAAIQEKIRLTEESAKSDTPLTTAEIDALVDAYVARMVEKNYE